MSDADQARQDGLIVTSAILTSLSTTLILLRCAVRFGVIRKPGWDDVMIIAGTLFTIGYLIILLVMRSNKIGFPMTTLTRDNMISLLKSAFATEVMYYTIIFTIKSSILFMYLRFAVSKVFRYLCHGTLILLAVFFLICIFGTVGQCRPLDKAWDISRTMPGTCTNTTAFFYFTSGFNIVTDFWILLLPILTLRKIHIPPWEKWALYCVFGIGSFATALSCVRLQSIYRYTLAADPFHDAISVNLWSMIEINTALVCANIPALKPLFKPRSLMESVRGSIRKKSGYKYRSYERYGISGHTRTDSSASGTGIMSINERHIERSPESADSADIIGLKSIPEAYLGV
ncbi:integral membrane protein [Xylariales sp. AK1849]|nr:integral membrane protein [Xylariales sp. AK1849]